MKQKDRMIVSAVVTLATVGMAAGVALLARRKETSLKGLVIDGILERPAGRSSFSELAISLEKAGQHLAARIDKASDSPENREVLMHIIGIERWGQNRILVALEQQQYIADEYKSYRPASDNSTIQLAKLMQQTRQRTIELAYELHKKPPHEDKTVDHNSLGPLSAKGWLRYLTHHADLESRRLRSGREEVESGNEANSTSSEAAKQA